MEKLVTIEYLSPQHNESVELRNRVLRKPIGLEFSDQDLKDEAEATHLACYLSDEQGEDKLVGACFLTSYKDDTVKLRQMAVDPAYHKRGIGSKLISFAEDLSRERGYKFVYLHARKHAVDFYVKQNYSLKSDEFIEVGIPHYEMLKEL